MSHVTTQIPDVRVAVVGNVDSGKSTLIGVLTSGKNDNGRGLARKHVYTHAHEEQTGRTSAVSHHIMGFDAEAKPVHQTVASCANSLVKTKGWEKVVSNSSSVVTFVDLCGHEAYLKTTIAGLTGSFPDHAMVLINSLAGVTKMTKEHLGVVIALGIPFCCVVTKVDMCPPNVLKRTKTQLFKILKHPAAGKKMPIHIRTEADVESALEKQIARGSSRLCPVVFISSVTGECLPLLVKYIAGLKPGRGLQLGLAPGGRRRRTSSNKENSNSATKGNDDKKEGAADPKQAGLRIQGDDESKQPEAPAANGNGNGIGEEGGEEDNDVEFHIDHTFNVPGAGLVVSGTLVRGEVQADSSAPLYLGPMDADGSFLPVIVRSIQSKRVNVATVRADFQATTCCFAIRPMRRKDNVRRTQIRRGMVLLNHAGTSTFRFQAEVLILHHHSTISDKYQAVIHMGDIRQTGQITHIKKKDCLRTGDKASISFRFLFRPEYVVVGSTFLFREGSTKGVGRVTSVVGDGADPAARPKRIVAKVRGRHHRRNQQAQHVKAAA